MAKILYLLADIDDMAYCRRILTQFNRGESHYRMARRLFHAQRVELRQRYGEGQSDQLGALGLVTSVVALGNTPYLDAGLNYPRVQGVAIQRQSLIQPTPWDINTSIYWAGTPITLTERITRGQLCLLPQRPIRPLHLGTMAPLSRVFVPIIVAAPCQWRQVDAIPHHLCAIGD
jgi:hypothetical protein